MDSYDTMDNQTKHINDHNNIMVMSLSSEEWNEMFERQRGIQDGVSLAYNVDTTELTIGMALEAAKWNNKVYLEGLIEGFQYIQEAINKPVKDLLEPKENETEE